MAGEMPAARGWRSRDFDVARVFRPRMRRLVFAIVCTWAMLVVGASAAIAAGEPAASTGNATAITPTSATLNGTVNPEAQATSYYFEYGTSNAYGSQTPTSPVGSGSADVSVSAPLSGLTPESTYHYRVVAINASGTTLGSDVSFTTPKPPPPAASTGHAGDITQTSATLSATVDPHGQATSYVFDYGTSTAYGSQTPAASAGAGNRAISVAQAVAGLSPGTTYHYRVAATGANGTTYGHDVAFKTTGLPAALTIAGVPSTITFGQLATVAGRVLPPRPSHVTVTLQSAPSAGGPWMTDATTATDSSGTYSFPRLAPSSNIYYRVLSDGATSGAVGVTVRFRVGVRVSRRHAPRGSTVRFYGRVGPAHFWHRVLIQQLGAHGRWHTIKRTRLTRAHGGASFYSARVRIERTGRYRVLVGPDADHAAGISPSVRIRLR
jgi:phosphodiesterase/alkaline phosphatase D-like protein